MEHANVQANNGILEGTLPAGVSLTINPKDVHYGDPPTSLPPNSTLQIPPIDVPFPPVSPLQPNPAVGGWGMLSTLVGNPWNVKFEADGRFVARCDVPGATADSLKVEIIGRAINVSYVRFDTSGTNRPSAQLFDASYDPKTATASLELGVLTVTMMRFPEKQAIRVPVTVK